MLRPMMAELIFANPNQMHPARIELVKRGFKVRFLEDWFDQHGPHVWLLATIACELDQSAFYDWMRAIVEPLGGDVLEAGLTPEDIEAWIESKS